jgi:hypothetical protein
MTMSSNWDTGVARAFHAATKYHAGPGTILMGPGTIPLRPSAGLPATAIEDVIFARRSTRQYDPQQSVTFEAFSTVLECSSRGFRRGCLGA